MHVCERSNFLPSPLRHLRRLQHNFGTVTFNNIRHLTAAMPFHHSNGPSRSPSLPATPNSPCPFPHSFAVTILSPWRPPITSSPKIFPIPKQSPSPTPGAVSPPPPTYTHSPYVPACPPSESSSVAPLQTSSGSATPDPDSDTHSLLDAMHPTSTLDDCMSNTPVRPGGHTGVALR